ncbi:MAG: SpoIID/LytB domain-containing protein, partial [Myxococcota bacterium]
MGEPTLRVGLASNRERAALSLRGAYKLGAKVVGPLDGLEAVAEPGAVRLMHGGVELARGTQIALLPVDDDAAFVLHKMTVGVDFHWQHEQDLVFHGAVSLESRGPVFDVIDEVGLETYLRSVISSEMSARCPPAALRAHAIISRSWLLAQLVGGAEGGAAERQRSVMTPTYVGRAVRLVRWYDREDHQHFDVCADDHCQRYQGITRTSTPEATAAVADTRGMVLMSEARVCDARFSKCCGGVTEVFPAAWGDVDVPYLQAFPDDAAPAAFAVPLTDEANATAFIGGSPPAFCNTTDRALLDRVLPELDHATTQFYRWTQTVSATDVRRFVLEKAGIELGRVVALRPIERGPSGRLVRLEIEGEDHTLLVGKELEIRRLLSRTHLYS